MVVLVDDTDKPLGLARKSEIHTSDTPLHRGFSAFIFDTGGPPASPAARRRQDHVAAGVVQLCLRSPGNG